ncbi:diaminopimelate epimerase [Microbacter margulisiae]|uniref:Diaminopimelate epimerase n=1 Tax=Microbacter margulisiae TaxID=1350067 RepID=A0A7W5DR97_9PORP|nr:diaminopimelate epimerase [Microbacter margulisiae]MBB3187642.1 diaminopimelate epimerase [Microbacter margulisiae]
MKDNFFVKSHGLGNEYLVLDSDAITFELSAQAIRRLCNTNYGLGTDGILLKTNSTKADVGLLIFNPDGSEAEKSGNGIRIFCKYVFDYKIIQTPEFTVETKGGIVHANILETHQGKAKVIRIDIGKAIFQSKLIPTLYDTEEVQDVKARIHGKEFEINCVSVGNPHCVILKETLDAAEIKEFGTYIEHFHMFPNRINTQFVKIINRERAEILIWERGAGFTLASGTSSCAVASVLKKKGLIDSKVTVQMIGGELTVEVDDDFNIRLTGEVRQICEGILNPELLEDIHLPIPK